MRGWPEPWSRLVPAIVLDWGAAGEEPHWWLVQAPLALLLLRTAIAEDTREGGGLS